MCGIIGAIGHNKVSSLLIEGLNKIDGVVCPKPKGAFYAIAQLPVDDADKFAQWLLEEFDLNGETVMVAPAAGFYSTPNMGTNQVRIAYVLNKKSLQKAIDCLESALKRFKRKIFNAVLWGESMHMHHQKSISGKSNWGLQEQIRNKR